MASLQGPNIDVFCDNPDYPEDKGNVDLASTTPNPWPVCEPLPCTCLGSDDLTPSQGLNITQKSCLSEQTIDYFKDVLNRTYTIPRRENCGTYKPTDPTAENKCICPEQDTRKSEAKKLTRPVFS